MNKPANKTSAEGVCVCVFVCFPETTGGKKNRSQRESMNVNTENGEQQELEGTLILFILVLC